MLLAARVEAKFRGDFANADAIQVGALFLNTEKSFLNHATFRRGAIVARRLNSWLRFVSVLFHSISFSYYEANHFCSLIGGVAKGVER